MDILSLTAVELAKAIRFPFGQGPADEHTQAVADELTVGGDGMLRVTC